MPRWPAGLHQAAGSLRNTGAPGYLPPLTPMHRYTQPVRAPIGNGAGQSIVNSSGAAIVALGPSGVGTRWYPSEIQISTTTGPTDLSSCELYKLFIAPTQRIGQTLQGGGDTIGWTAQMQPGELIYAVWADANPGDLATLAIHGDQVVLT